MDQYRADIREMFAEHRRRCAETMARPWEGPAVVMEEEEKVPWGDLLLALMVGLEVLAIGAFYIC